MIDAETLSQLEKANVAGLTSAEILDVFARHDVQLSEATLRKYVQLGLLPRSVRVGRKGKHQGSQGVYPVSVVRQILRIKQMMSESYTIDQIQRQRAVDAEVCLGRCFLFDSLCELVFVHDASPLRSVKKAHSSRSTRSGRFSLCVSPTQA